MTPFPTTRRRVLLPLSGRQRFHCPHIGAQAGAGRSAGAPAEDVVLARANYAKLDAGGPVRIRLNSTAVRVKHVGDAASAKEVEVVYARGGKVYAARAANCILACWHVVVPYICEELPAKQKEALASAAKVPLLYTNVELRNWKAFEKVKANSFTRRGCTTPT